MTAPRPAPTFEEALGTYYDAVFSYAQCAVKNTHRVEALNNLDGATLNLMAAHEAAVAAAREPLEAVDRAVKYVLGFEEPSPRLALEQLVKIELIVGTVLLPPPTEGT